MKAQGLPLNTIVLAVVAVIVLVVVVIAFVPAVGNMFGVLAGTAPTGDADTCQIHCQMLQANLFVQYPSQTKPYRYCTDQCVGIFPCEVNGVEINDFNCDVDDNGYECDSNHAECPGCCDSVSHLCEPSECSTDGDCTSPETCQDQGGGCGDCA